MSEASLNEGQTGGKRNSSSRIEKKIFCMRGSVRRNFRYKFSLPPSSSSSSFAKHFQISFGKFNDLSRNSNGKTHICTSFANNFYNIHSQVNSSVSRSYQFLSLWKRMNKFKFLIVRALWYHTRVSSFQRYQTTLSFCSCMIFPNELTRATWAQSKMEKRKATVLSFLFFFWLVVEHSTTENFITTIVKCVCRFAFFSSDFFSFFLFNHLPLVSSATSTHSHPEIVPLICTHEQPRRTHNHIHI